MVFVIRRVDSEGSVRQHQPPAESTIRPLLACCSRERYAWRLHELVSCGFKKAMLGSLGILCCSANFVAQHSQPSWPQDDFNMARISLNQPQHAPSWHRSGFRQKRRCFAMFLAVLESTSVAHFFKMARGRWQKESLS